MPLARQGTGEGNANPPQCSCLENLRDGGAWWAAVYGVAQSWIRLKRLSSSRQGTWEEVSDQGEYSHHCPDRISLVWSASS